MGDKDGQLQGTGAQETPPADTPDAAWDAGDHAGPGVEIASLRFLRRLVTGLTAVMIAGMVILIALFVTRFPSNDTALPDAITLPDGTTATAFTVGSGWYAVVTGDDRILIYDRNTGDLRQTVRIKTETD